MPADVKLCTRPHKEGMRRALTSEDARVVSASLDAFVEVECGLLLSAHHHSGAASPANAQPQTH